MQPGRTEQQNARSHRAYQCRSRQQSWQPGESGNPAGRPPNVKYLSEALIELLRTKNLLLTLRITKLKNHKFNFRFQVTYNYPYAHHRL